MFIAKLGYRQSMPEKTVDAYYDSIGTYPLSMIGDVMDDMTMLLHVERLPSVGKFVEYLNIYRAEYKGRYFDQQKQLTPEKCQSNPAVGKYFKENLLLYLSGKITNHEWIMRHQEGCIKFNLDYDSREIDAVLSRPEHKHPGGPLAKAMSTAIKQ